MKIAFDENIGALSVKMFQSLAEAQEIRDAEFVSARDFSRPGENCDVPWIERFRQSGGDVMISGDIEIRRKPHQRKAIADTGLVAVFLAGRWGHLDSYTKTAMLIQWWPEIEAKIKNSPPGKCWEVPCNWSRTELRDVTGPVHR